MNRENIIRMAREAGMPTCFDSDDLIFAAQVERFAALVVAAEREACASIDFRHIVGLSNDQDFLVSQAIRARGQE